MLIAKRIGDKLSPCMTPLFVTTNHLTIRRSNFTVTFHDSLEFATNVMICKFFVQKIPIYIVNGFTKIDESQMNANSYYIKQQHENKNCICSSISCFIGKPCFRQYTVNFTSVEKKKL